MRRIARLLAVVIIGIGLSTAAASTSIITDTCPVVDTQPGYSAFGTGQPVRVVSSSGGVSGADALVHRDTGSTTLSRGPSDPPAVIVLDYGHVVSGVPEFDVRSETQTPELGASYAEALRFLADKGDGGAGFESGDPARHDVYTVRNPGLIDNRVIQGGERYQQLTLLSTGSITLNSVRIRPTDYQGDYQGRFVSSSDQLNKLWYAGAQTLRLNMLPPGSPSGYRAGFDQPQTNVGALITDGAKRDRDVWEGDLSIEALTTFYAFNTPEYVRDSLRLLGSYQHPSGFIEGRRAPGDPLEHPSLSGEVSQYSASYSMYFVANLATYYRYTGDRAFVTEEWPIAQRELAWNATHLDEHGLFVTDTADGANWHYDVQVGAQTYYNALYYRILLDAADLAETLGDPTAADYRARANGVKAAVNRYLFDPNVGVYNVSLTQQGVIAQDANTFAVRYGIAPADRVPAILATMSRELATPHGDLSVSTPAPMGYHQVIGPFMGSYELLTRLGTGDDRGAFDLLHREWDQMTTVDPTDVLWEVLGPDGTTHTPGINGNGDGRTSLAHGWSTGPTAALSEYVLGISPTGPGYRTWQVAPHPGTLSWAQGQVPTPAGPLGVRWCYRNNAFVLNISAPPNTHGTVVLPR